MNRFREKQALVEPFGRVARKGKISFNFILGFSLIMQA